MIIRYFFSLLVAMLFFYSTSSECMRKPIVKASSKKTMQGMIVPYLAEHKKHVEKMAVAFMPYLVDMDDSSPESCQKKFDEQFKKALQESSIKKYVYLNKDKAVGFISYYFYSPWYKILMNKNAPYTRAHLLSLMVDNEDRQQGIGNQLIHHCVNNCDESNIKKIKLEITPTGVHEGLVDFYRKFDFHPNYQNFSTANGTITCWRDTPVTEQK